MNILLYVPDNQVTNNFVPQLWPFVLKRLTPSEHCVTIIDGNAEHYTEQELVDFIRVNRIDLVGMGFMTRMAQKAYRMAAAIRRSTGVPVVMGGPHVTEVPDEPLGRTGHAQYADAVVLGEADDIWPLVLQDLAQGRLQPIYEPPKPDGKSSKPTLENYPAMQWDQEDLSRFNLMRFLPASITKLLKRLRVPYDQAYVIPMETGRGCPYGCEFCTVTGFFGDEIRFRDHGGVVDELLALKALSKKQNALLSVFFIDDNFAINRKRTKELLREMIRRDACLPWIAQISMNLLRDEELVQLIAASGGRWIFMGLESVDPDSLKVANKGFNKPQEYGDVLNLLASYGVYAITSFIFGMEGDRTGVAEQTCLNIDAWPPGLPVFGILTPYPATPLYNRLKKEGRLTRPEHWLDFQAFKSAYLPKNFSAQSVEEEIKAAWTHCYAPAAFRRAQRWLLENRKPFEAQLTHFIARLLFRGIYFRQMTKWAWVKLMAQNVPTFISLVRSGYRTKCNRRTRQAVPETLCPAKELPSVGTAVVTE
jgi:radical SAM superfamily enzyme YgiQ (UPF0313 family)